MHPKMSDLKNPECTLCNKTFPILEVLNDHMKLIHHESSSIRLVRLEETIKTALEESSVRRDDIKDHKSLDYTECGICFSNGEEKINHENKHHTQKKNEYICDLCDRIFPNRVERSNHMLFVHIQKSKNFKCDYSSNCGEVFNGLKQLCLHISEKHGDLFPKKLDIGNTCDMCYTKLTTKEEVTSHKNEKHSPDSFYEKLVED